MRRLKYVYYHSLAHKGCDKIDYFIIYSYTNLVNGKRYIGQTKSPEERHKRHFITARYEKGPGYDYPFYAAIRKYGEENFRYEILAKDLTQDLANTMEEYYIELYNSMEHGYNLLSGGNNASKAKTEEAVVKMSKAKAAFTDEEIKELRLAYKNKEKPSEIYREKYSERVKYQSFYNIWCGKRYSHIMPEVFTKGQKRRTKFTAEQVLEVRRLYKEGNWTHKQLGEKFGMSEPTVADIIKRRTWKHI